MSEVYRYKALYLFEKLKEIDFLLDMRDLVVKVGEIQQVIQRGLQDLSERDCYFLEVHWIKYSCNLSSNLLLFVDSCY